MKAAKVKAAEPCVRGGSSGGPGMYGPRTCMISVSIVV